MAECDVFGNFCRGKIFCHFRQNTGVWSKLDTLTATQPQTIFMSTRDPFISQETGGIALYAFAQFKEKFEKQDVCIQRLMFERARTIIDDKQKNMSVVPEHERYKVIHLQSLWHWRLFDSQRGAEID